MNDTRDALSLLPRLASTRQPHQAVGTNDPDGAASTHPCQPIGFRQLGESLASAAIARTAG